MGVELEEYFPAMVLTKLEAELKIQRKEKLAGLSKFRFDMWYFNRRNSSNSLGFGGACSRVVLNCTLITRG